MCEILDDLKMNFEAHHDIYLPPGQCWHVTYTLNFYLQKSPKQQQQQQQQQQQKQEKKSDVKTRVPRRARWDFWGVLDDSLFFIHLKFDMNKYLKNWGNYEVLRMELGEFIVTIFFIYGSFHVLRCFCLQFWNFTGLSVLHIP